MGYSFSNNVKSLKWFEWMRIFVSKPMKKQQTSKAKARCWYYLEAVNLDLRMAKRTDLFGKVIAVTGNLSVHPNFPTVRLKQLLSTSK